MNSSVNDVPTNSSTFGVEHITPTEEELRTVPQRSYKCDICGIQVKTLANLRIHRVKTHRIVESDSDVAVLYRTKRGVKKVFHCPVSGCKYQDHQRGFPKQSALRQHYIWVHGGRNHMCSLCFRLFPSLSMLERHKISCGQCHICVQCGRRYSELKYLRQHMKRANHTGESTEASTLPKASVEHLENVQQAEISNAISDQGKTSPPMPPTVSNAPKVEASQVACLQPVILPVVIPIPMASSASEIFSSPSFDPQALAEAVSCAIRPVIERMSVEAETQTPQVRQPSSPLVQVSIPSSSSLQLVEKAEEVHMTSTGFMNMSNFVDTGVATISSDLNLHPVGSQTEALFENPYDRPCLHVETQTSDIFNHSITCEPSRNLQTPQPPMAGTQTLEQAVTAEYLSNMQTQTEPIDAWIDADFSDIETQTTDYDLETLLSMTCSQTQTNV